MDIVLVILVVGLLVVFNGLLVAFSLLLAARWLLSPEHHNASNEEPSLLSEKEVG